MKKRIDLDYLADRIKAWGKPTPQQVLDLIAQMYKELEPDYTGNSMDHVNC